MGVLTAQGLSRYHGEVVAVNDLTVDFEPGITGLLGPNGAGKTTLFRMATGLQKPSAGTIRVLGEDPWDNAKLLSRIAYVPDGQAPWPDVTGRQAVVRMGRFGGLAQPEAEAQAVAALDRVGLTAAADRLVGNYSRGMQQRLKFAFALLHKPELYLLDEPLIATDPLTRRDLVKLIRDLAREGSSVIISTHVLPDVEALTERIALMARGRLLAHGTVPEIREVLERYPRTIRIATTAPRELGIALWSLDSVLSMETTDVGIVVRTRQPAAFYDDLQRVLETKNVPFTSITPLDENVEAIFRYLVSE